MSFAGLGAVYPPLSNGAGASTPSSHRFVPHNFQYNGRVALALLPSLGVSLGCCCRHSRPAANLAAPRFCTSWCKVDPHVNHYSKA